MPPQLTEQLSAFDPVLDPAAAAHYTTDWTGDVVGRARMILRPRDTAEIARIVSICAAAEVPVIPQGGHTGLVGGGTPSGDGAEVVISLERLNRIRGIDPLNYSMVAEAGCILENVQAAALAADRFFPLSLGAQGSCQIGGNIATNAGGINVLRYGMTRNLVLGLEVVLPDGQIWHGLKALHKDNTGYDLKQLFLGAEGTLGIVTAAALKLSPRPTQIATAFLAVRSIEAAIELYAQARRDLSDLLSAFELLPRAGLELAIGAVPDLRDPIAAPAPYYILMEVSASGLVDLGALVDRFLENAISGEQVIDGAVAANAKQARDFWRIREGLVEGQMQRGRHLRTDVSVAISQIAEFLHLAHKAVGHIAPEAEPLAYGHIGDGNIHFNVLPPRHLDDAGKLDIIHQCETAIFEVIDRLHGSISAEHGIGFIKRPFFLERVPAVELRLMKGLKHLFDPGGMMNPGRILDSSKD